MATNIPTLLQPGFLKKLERLRLVAKRFSWAGARGEHSSPRKGFSLEFSDYKKYHSGDDLRYVDWNIYRRLDRLCLKVFTAEQEMNLYLLVDTSRSMAEGLPQKMDYAKKLAAALGYIGLKNLDRVAGGTFSSDLQSSLPLARGKKQILRLFEFLGALTCRGETDLRTSVKSFSSVFRRPGLVVLLSDLLDPQGYRLGLEELQRKKYQVLVIHILDEAENNLELSGDVSLFDVETEHERRLFLDADLVRRFREEVQNYFEEVESCCVSHGMDYLRTTTATPFEDFILMTLRQVRSVR
ncbi:MAG: DUF58 domain-containing protein [Candidatus Binatia bacterium]